MPLIRTFSTTQVTFAAREALRELAHIRRKPMWETLEEVLIGALRQAQAQERVASFPTRYDESSDVGAVQE